MAYGYNDGDQRPQSVRLAGRTTPTPRSTSDNGNPQRPQEQPGASSRRQSRTAQQSDRVSTSTRQRQTDTSQPRRYDRRTTDHYVKRTQLATSTRSRQFRPSPRVAHHKPRASGPPPTPCALLQSPACLVFVFLGSCISHGSAGTPPTAEDRLLKAPVAPGYSFACLDPTLAMAGRHHAPHLPN